MESPHQRAFEPVIELHQNKFSLLVGTLWNIHKVSSEQMKLSDEKWTAGFVNWRIVPFSVRLSLSYIYALYHGTCSATVILIGSLESSGYAICGVRAGVAHTPLDEQPCDRFKVAVGELAPFRNNGRSMDALQCTRDLEAVKALSFFECTRTKAE